VGHRKVFGRLDEVAQELRERPTTGSSSRAR
jgi:hypothetical protein